MSVQSDRQMKNHQYAKQYQIEICDVLYGDVI